MSTRRSVILIVAVMVGLFCVLAIVKYVDTIERQPAPGWTMISKDGLQYRCEGPNALYRLTSTSTEIAVSPNDPRCVR